MPPKSVVFYAISSSFLDVSFKLIEKIYSLGEKALVLCDNEDEVRFFDSKLWTFSKLSFIPHGSRFSATQETLPFCKVWFSDKIDCLNEPENLIHNGLDISSETSLNRFQKIIDVFDKSQMAQAKDRFENYRKIGFADQKLWIQGEKVWEPGSF